MYLHPEEPPNVFSNSKHFLQEHIEPRLLRHSIQSYPMQKRKASVVDVVSGRQTKCMCQSACLSSRCRCRKAQQKCNIYCHKTSSNCQNS
jgi:hypothetical protein